jgi:hypothetical protein
MVNDIKGMYEDYENIKELNEISGSTALGTANSKGNEQVGIPSSKDTIIMSTNADSSKMVIGGHDTDGKGGSAGFHTGTLSKQEVKKRYPTALKKKS